MAQMKEKDATCMGGVCAKCWGMKLLITGILILLNQYAFRIDWWVFIAILFILWGLSKMMMPKGCKHCR